MAESRLSKATKALQDSPLAWQQAEREWDSAWVHAASVLAQYDLEGTRNNLEDWLTTHTFASLSDPDSICVRVFCAWFEQLARGGRKAAGAREALAVLYDHYGKGCQQLGMARWKHSIRQGLACLGPLANARSTRRTELSQDVRGAAPNARRFLEQRMGELGRLETLIDQLASELRQEEERESFREGARPKLALGRIVHVLREADFTPQEVASLVEEDGGHASNRERRLGGARKTYLDYRAKGTQNARELMRRAGRLRDDE